MDSNRFDELMISYLQGHSSEEDRREFERLLEESEQYQEEYRRSKWLFDTLRNNTALIKQPHLSRRLLLEYVESPDVFESFVVERIRAHLKECKECNDNYAIIEKLASIKLTPPTGDIVDTRAGLLRSLWRKFVSYWIVDKRRLVFAVVLLAAVSAGVWVVSHKPTEPSLQVVLSDEYSPETPTYSGPVLLVTLGPREDDLTTVIDEPLGVSYYFAITVDILDSTRLPGTVTVNNVRGQAIWRASFDRAHLINGQLFLEIPAGELGGGRYDVKIADRPGRTLARSAFSIAK